MSLTKVSLLAAMQCVLQNAINKINSAASSSVCSTDAINEVQCAASNSGLPFIKSTLLPPPM
jgi:hypothetical protein